MKSRKTEESLALLGGALLGAAAMYFLDPQAGERRRRRIAMAAGGACENARGLVGGGFRTVAGRARDFTSHLGGHAREAHESAAEYAQRLSAHAHDLASSLTERAAGYLPHDPAAAIESGRRMGAKWFDRVSKHAHGHVEQLQNAGHRLWDRARGFVGAVPDAAAERAQQLREDLADRTDDWRKAAASRVSRASHTAQSWLGHEEREGFGVGTILSSTAGCLVVGAGAMYFLDPQRGRARRSWAVDKANAIVHKTGRTMRGIGKDVANRMRGAACETESLARNLVSRARVDTEQLISRIRSEMGHMSARANSVQFMADADGTVTVTGEIGRDEVDGLLALLHRMPGVVHVINRTTVHDPVAGASGMSSRSPSQR